MSRVETVDYAGATLVAGLLWQPLVGSSPSERNAEIKAFGKELDLNLQVLQREMICVGLAKAGSVIKPGAISLAAAVSQKVFELHNARDFILAMELEEGGWYYLAQKDGVVLPDGDQIIREEDGIKARYYTDASLAEWSVAFLPSHWGITGSKEPLTLEAVLPRKGKGKGRLTRVKDWQLSPITVGPAQLIATNAKPLLVLAAVGLAMTVGIGQFKDWQRRKAITESQRLAAEEAARTPAPIPRPRPWGELPHAGDMINACLKATAGVQLFPGNWDLASVTCTNGVLTVAWRPRTYGWIEHLKQVIPDVVIALDGSLASVTRPLGQMPAASDEELHSPGDRLVAMYAAAQRYGVKFSTTPAANQSPQLLPGQTAEPEKPVLWEEVMWKADEVTLPETVITALDGNGFRMRSLSAQWQDGRFVWTMEGPQYVRK